MFVEEHVKQMPVKTGKISLKAEVEWDAEQTSLVNTLPGVFAIGRRRHYPVKKVVCMRRSVGVVPGL